MGVFQARLSWKTETRLINRPLLFLLPFYITGLALGPAFPLRLQWLWAVAASGLLLVVAQSLLRNRICFSSLAILFLLIGAASTVQTLTPPKSENHVFHFKHRDGLVFGGVIAEMPRVSEGRTRLVVKVDEMGEGGGNELRPVQGLVYITLADAPFIALTGQRVRFQAKLREIAGFSNPGGFNYERYMNAQGLWVSTYLSSSSSLVLVSEAGDEKPEGRFIARIRSKAAAYIDRYTRQPARGVFKAMLIGIRDEVDPDVTNAFRVFGLAHLLSISGLHVGVVALWSYLMIYRLLLLRPNLALKYNLKHAAALISALPVLSYAALAGGRPSTIRAAVMVMIFLLSVLIDRKRDAVTALAAAAWFILIIQPAAIFLASFQLSFAAAGAILLTYRRFLAAPPTAAKDVSSTSDYIKQRLRQITLIPLAATLGTAPIAAWHFHRLPVLSLPVNILFTPLISLSVIPGGLMALTLAPLFPWAAQGLFFLLEKLLWIFLLPIESLAGHFGLEWLAPQPGWLFIAVYYLFFILAVSLPKGPGYSRKLLAAGAVLGCLAAVPVLYRHVGPELQMTVLDVGQGSAAHISFPDQQQMIIDGGGFPGSDFDPGESLIEPYLASKGITRLDVIVLSHPHADHVIGLPYLAGVFTPRELWTNQAPDGHRAFRALKRLAREQAMGQPSLETLHQPRRFGAAQVQVLWPPADYQHGQSLRDILADQNDYSLVVKVTLGNTAFLIPGDLEERGIAGLVQKWGHRLKSDVLVAPHHGDEDSLTTGLLSVVRPRYVAISAGRFNRFQLPSSRAVHRARAAGAVVLRTDLNGAITFVTDGRSLKVQTNR